MTYTIKDFMYECETYEHSREHFELMKECSELTMLQKFVDDQRFISENSDIITSGETTFTEGFFTEGVSDEKIDFYESRIVDKAKSILTRIRQGISRLMSRFVAFLKKIMAMFRKDEADKLIKKIRSLKSIKAGVADESIKQAVEGELAHIPFECEDVEGMKPMIADFKLLPKFYMIKNIKKFYKSSDFQNIAKYMFPNISKEEISDIFNSNLDIETYKVGSIISLVACGSLTLKGIADHSNIPFWALPIDDIVRIVKKYSSGKFTYSTDDIEKEFDIIRKGKCRSFTVLFNDPKLDENIKFLSGFVNGLNEEIRDEAMKADDPAEHANALNAYFKKMMTVISDTLKFYQAIVAYRKKCLNFLNTFITKCESGASSKSAPTDSSTPTENNTDTSTETPENSDNT